MNDKLMQLELLKRDRNSIVSSILVDNIYADGTINSFGGRFVKIFKILDINYKLSDDKHLIGETYKNVLNSIDKNVEVNIIVNAKKLSRKYIDEKVLLQKSSDGFNYLRDGINETINKNSNSDMLSKDKYLVIAFTEGKNINDIRVNNNKKTNTYMSDDCDSNSMILSDNANKKDRELNRGEVLWAQKQDNKDGRRGEVLVAQKEDNKDGRRGEVLRAQKQDNKVGRRGEACEPISIIHYEDRVSNKMQIVSSAIKRNFESIVNARLIELTRDETIKLLYFFYNKDRINDKLSNNNIDLLNFKTKEELGISYKDLVSPKLMEFYKDYIKFNNKYMIALHMQDINRQIDTDTLEKLTDNNFEVLIGLKERPIDALTTSKLISRELGNIEGEIYDIQKKLANKKVSVDLIPQMLKLRREEAIKINENIKTKNDGLFDMGLFAIVYGDSYEECLNNVYSFKNNAILSGIYFEISNNLQENVFNSIMPFGINQTLYTRCINSEGLTGFMPFNAMDLIDENGDYYGKNLITNNPVVYDVKKADNYSMLLFGMTGKGKSMIAKQTLLSRYLRDTKRKVIIIDVSGEYIPITNELKGQVINIEAGGVHHINLFDIDDSYGDNPLADKEDMILSVCGLMQKKKLTAGQRTTVSMVISEIYKKWQITKDERDIPTIKEFTETLRKIVIGGENNVGSRDESLGAQMRDSNVSSRGEALRAQLQNSNVDYNNNFYNIPQNYYNSYEDIELLKAIEYYSDKSYCTLFRGKSNIDFNKNIINYNISNLGKELKPMAMEVLLDNIWLTISKNRALGIDTDIIIDEFHLMFLNDDTASFMAKLWKMLRKSHGCPIGITQNPEDVLNSFFGRDIIANTGFLVSLSLLESDIKLLKDVLLLTEKEVEFLRNKEAGTGLIYVHSSKGKGERVVVPFENIYDENNIIYKLINTTDKINP